MCEHATAMEDIAAEVTGMRVPLRLAVAALTGMLLVVGPTANPRAADRPTVAGPNGAVSAGHPLTSAAAFEVLLKGGNAFDAGVAAMLVGGVVEQDLYSLGGEGLVLVYPQRERKITSIVGQGWAPKGATIEWYTSRGKNLNGIGLDPAVVPGVVHAALTVLERWGTMTFEQVSLRAVEYAERGFPLRPRTADAINNNRKFIDAWADNKRTWVKADGTAYKAGDTIKLPDLARTLSSMVEAERQAKRKGRAAGIAAARDLFYKGDIAREMVAFLKTHDAPWELSDFAEYFAKVEQPAMTTYRGYDVYKQSFGSQGPVLLESLNILEQFDLKSMKRNSGPYLHTIVEAMKLAYADRDSYYADQAFVQSPAEGLLSKEYARERGKQVDAQHASKGYLAGDPLRFDSKVKTWNYWIANLPNATEEHQAPEEDITAGVTKDTTHISVIDRDGNVFDSTPSGAWLPTSPILGKTGIAMSVRGESFWLDPSRAAQLRPRSRPRYTLTPTIVLHNGQPFLAIGTPGGDNQEQTILQAFLNIVEFWPEWYPNLHEAFRWPRVQTLHFYGSFWPHPAGFNKLNVESDMPEEVYQDLKTKGHDVSKIAPASIASCATAVLVDPASGNRIAGADPRRDCYAMAY
jgi:gamma-glutamyltranspeptidase / glutathione hydrolase